MGRIVVADSSTLILLEKVLLLDKLVKKYNFVIPEEVHNEAVIKGKSIKSKDAYSIESKISKNTIKVEKVKDIATLNKLIGEFDLAQGEAEAIALHLEKKANILAVDDHKAINVCKIYKIPFMTALTFVVKAFKAKQIARIDAKEMIKNLEIYGRYKGDLVYKALEHVGGKND